MLILITFAASIPELKCQHKCISERTCEAKQVLGECFYLFNDKQLTWNENEELCKSHNLTMIKVTGKMIEDGFTIPADFYNQEHVWLGGKAQDLDAWQFVNGLPLDETYFNKPSDIQGRFYIQLLYKTIYESIV